MEKKTVTAILEAQGWRWEEHDGRIRRIERTVGNGSAFPLDIPKWQDVEQAVSHAAKAFDANRWTVETIRESGGSDIDVNTVAADAGFIRVYLEALDEAFAAGFHVMHKTLGDITGKACGNLRAEVTGYIVGYWQEADDGHPYYAIQHDGKTTRDMARDYMRERYEDYLEGMADGAEAGSVVKLIGEAPGPVAGDTMVEKAMDAFDQMFDELWPAEHPDPERLQDPDLVAGALELALNQNDRSTCPTDYLWRIDPDDIDSIAKDVIDNLEQLATGTHKPGTKLS